MHSFSAGVRFHAMAFALAAASALLLGCARRLQIEVPADFHGRVHITCTGLSSDRLTILRTFSGEVLAATCPERQSEVTVLRTGSPTPVDAAVLWTSTGDGIVREITFDVK